MNRVLAFLIVAVMLLSFASCESNKEQAAVSCWNCGGTISKTAVFCENCGSAVADNPNKAESSTTESTQSTTEGTVGAGTTDTTEPPTTTSPTTTTPTTEVPHSHSYSAKVTTAATCDKDGVKAFTCVCGSSYTEKIAATGHAWSSWTTVTPADVGKAGQEKRTCSSCNQSETQTIPALQEDTTKKWFVAQYSLAKQQYIDGLNSDVDEKQGQIEDLEKELKILADNYTKEVAEIYRKYGGSSGATAQLNLSLENAKLKYKSSSKVYDDKITALENEISAIEAEISNPNVDKILTICAQNSNTSSKEIYEYYYKYSDSLS